MVNTGRSRNPVSGLEVRHQLSGPGSLLRGVAWSPDGKFLAAAAADGPTLVFGTYKQEHSIPISGAESVAWSPNSEWLAIASGGQVLLWSRITSELDHISELSAGFDAVLDWSIKGLLAVASFEGTLLVWDLHTRASVAALNFNRSIHSVAWSPNGTYLAVGSDGSEIRILQSFDQTRLEHLTTIQHRNSPLSTAWLSNQEVICGSTDVGIWRLDGSAPRLIETQSSPLVSIAISADARILAGKGGGQVEFWRTDSWQSLAVLPEPAVVGEFPLRRIAFHPTELLLASFGDSETAVQITELFPEQLFRADATRMHVSRQDAKLVLVGDSETGKTCLATRLSTGRYPTDSEQGTTHGMRFWELAVDEVPTTTGPQLAQIVIWDMGGQEEYRLVHQLFLHDATVAVVAFDPTRGQTAIDQIEAWNKALQKHLAPGARKLLVGTKVDEPTLLINYDVIEQVRSSLGFEKYLETGAKSNRGLAELKKALRDAVDWNSLSQISRPAVMHRIREWVGRRRKAGAAAVLFDDLDIAIRQDEDTELSQQTVTAVIDQLQREGTLATVPLPSGDRAVVLQIWEVERYAGSIIMAARNDSRGVATLEEDDIFRTHFIFPGITSEQRLGRAEERLVLECVVQLLIQHGICFRHEGLLVFPSLFRTSERDSVERRDSVSLYYDFSGAIDNIYASLVAWLVVKNKLAMQEVQFHALRLWADTAEFWSPKHGTCAVRKSPRKKGFAHLDVYFDGSVSNAARREFTEFVEHHLRQHGMEITEHIALQCPNCSYHFSEEDVRQRIARGDTDVGCVACDHRVSLKEIGLTGQEGISGRTVALRTRVQQEVSKSTRAPHRRRTQADGAQAIRILHLSDLHLSAQADPVQHIIPLVADLRRIGGHQIDLLIVSGDLTQHAQPKEFDTARDFMSRLVRDLELTAKRCVVVPGNHDVSWDEEVYRWVSRRQLGNDDAGSIPQGQGVLIRIPERYPERFRNFSEYFFHPLMQSEYPKAFDRQAIPVLFEDLRIQVLALNSCWEIDEWHADRASVHEGALVRGLREADAQLASSGIELQRVFRVAVWHHPVTGNEKIVNDAFLEHLKLAQFRILCHGHVHDNRSDLIGYLSRNKVHVCGTGSFGAPSSQRPESTPRLYNLIELHRDFSKMKVHTRSLRRDQGAWDTWAVWDAPKGLEKRSYYEVKFSGHA